MNGLLADPQKLSMLLSGMGLLTSKYEDQADKWKAFGARGLLSGAETRRAEQEKAAEIARMQPMDDAKLAYMQAQTNALTNKPSKQGFSGSGLKQQAFNIISSYNNKLNNNQPITHKDEQDYRLAHQYATQPNYVNLPNGNTMELPGMDLSGFYNPFGGVESITPTATAKPPTPITEPKIISSKKPVGVTSMDQKYATDYLEWTQNGSADVEKSIVQLTTAINDIKTGKTTTGGVRGFVDAVTPDFIEGAIDPNFVNTKDQVEEVVQRNLRIILGAQFTEKEGERLIARAYNTSLTPEQNAARLNRLLKQIKDAAAAKNDMATYYEENQTIAGYKGKRFTNKDFDPDILFADIDLTPAQKRIKELEKKHGLDNE